MSTDCSRSHPGSSESGSASLPAAARSSIGTAGTLADAPPGRASHGDAASAGMAATTARRPIGGGVPRQAPCSRSSAASMVGEDDR
eukprot:scaffold30374_cov107-Isochrysis_galbana.AAC.4